MFTDRRPTPSDSNSSSDPSMTSFFCQFGKCFGYMYIIQFNHIILLAENAIIIIHMKTHTYIFHKSIRVFYFMLKIPGLNVHLQILNKL